MFQMMERFVAQINTQMNAQFAEKLERSHAKFAQISAKFEGLNEKFNISEKQINAQFVQTNNTSAQHEQQLV